MPHAPLAAEAGLACHGGGCGGGHLAMLAHGGLMHGGLMHGAVASAQHEDYVSPTAKFHPVPIHPVFEPQPQYPPPFPMPGPEPRRDHFHPGY
jgi:hypothetical protein